VTSSPDHLTEARERIQELEQSLRTAQEELQFFVYAASHDLQQPLRTVNTHAQLLLRTCPENERAKEITATITAAVTQMSGLVASLVAYSRQGTALAERTYLPLNTPVQCALFKLSALIQTSGAQVESGELPEVFGDENQLTTLFENLISNSIKFRAAEPARIEISTEDIGDSQIISIRDNGCGIRPEFHEAVFLPFKRLHGRDVPGSGLGLSLCRKIVAAHEGRIWIESDGTAGTAVKFTLAQ
jgi:light-regulated signal transduction histidine kinase (bacteriophytochrome)